MHTSEFRKNTEITIILLSRMPPPDRFNLQQPARILGRTFLHVSDFGEFIAVKVFPPGPAAFDLAHHPDPDPDETKAILRRLG